MPGKIQRRRTLPPLSDPRITLVPKISELLRNALQRQSDAVAILLRDQAGGEFPETIANLMQGIREMADLMPKIEAATDFALNAGWEYGSKRAVSEQNTKNVSSRHRRSNSAKDELYRLWSTGRWPTKVSCVEENYEHVMREVGLWEDDPAKLKPNVQTLIRWLQTTK